MTTADSGAHRTPDQQGGAPTNDEKWENLPLLKEHRITSLRELEALYSPTVFEERFEATHGDFYFRGQEDAWRMTPSIWRTGSESLPSDPDPDNFALRRARAAKRCGFARHPRHPWSAPKDQDPSDARAGVEILEEEACETLQIKPEAFQNGIKLHVRWLELEASLLRDFARLCARAGLDCPDAVRGHGLDPLDVFSTWPLVRPFELMSLAQHFGIPTRLLDFSRSFFTALHFALEAPRKGERCRRPTIYLVRQGDCMFDMYCFQSYYGVSSTNRRLVAQRGLFIYMPMAEYQFYLSGKWPSLEDLVEKHLPRGPSQPPVVQRILIELSAEDRMKAHSRLAAFGAVGGDMFPEHERFADEVRRIHKIDPSNGDARGASPGQAPEATP